MGASLHATSTMMVSAYVAHPSCAASCRRYDPGEFAMKDAVTSLGSAAVRDGDVHTASDDAAAGKGRATMNTSSVVTVDAHNGCTARACTATAPTCWMVNGAVYGTHEGPTSPSTGATATSSVASAGAPAGASTKNAVMALTANASLGYTGGAPNVPASTRTDTAVAKLADGAPPPTPGATATAVKTYVPALDSDTGPEYCRVAADPGCPVTVTAGVVPSNVYSSTVSGEGGQGM